jgi:hypothetical protein
MAAACDRIGINGLALVFIVDFRCLGEGIQLCDRRYKFGHGDCGSGCGGKVGAWNSAVTVRGGVVYVTARLPVKGASVVWVYHLTARVHLVRDDMQHNLWPRPTTSGGEKAMMVVLNTTNITTRPLRTQANERIDII